MRKQIIRVLVLQAVSFSIKAAFFLLLRDWLTRAVQEEMRNGRYAYRLEGDTNE